jgi:hypothetical protein
MQCARQSLPGWQQAMASVASLLGRLDEWLETAGALPKLDPSPQLSDDQIMEFDNVRAENNA